MNSGRSSVRTISVIRRKRTDSSQPTVFRLPLRCQFATFAGQCHALLVNATSTEARAIGAELGARTFGTSDDADFRLEVVSPGPERARGSLRVGGLTLVLDVPQPGAHNTPEPSCLALAGMGLGCLAAARLLRRRRPALATP